MFATFIELFATFIEFHIHHEAIAGNLNLVNLLLKYGADKNARTNSGKTAAEFAENLGWKHIVKVLA